MATTTKIQEPLNLEAWKQYTNFAPPPKLKNLSPSFMKGFFGICIFTIFSLCYFFLSALIWRDPAVIRAAYRAQPPSRETNISHILFGIGGSAETWSRRRHYCELWWKPNATRGYVWLDSPPPGDEPWPETSPPYRISGDTARFKYTNQFGSRSAIRMARIVKESFELVVGPGSEEVRWFVMGDDDTVFFPENLVNVLGKYDYREMYYIGSNSESVEQDLEHSYTMGYGGGGFAISRPLAAALARILDGCIDRYAGAYGSDQKIGGCMSEIGVPVTKEVGFHQMDIRGSPYGLLSAHPLAPLVSLHHLDYIQPLFPGQTRVGSIENLIRAYNADPSRILQQTFCYDHTRDWSVSVSWGYNVQLYPFLVTGKDLSTPLRTFLTWGSWSEEPFTFNTRVMSLNPCERPIIYYLHGVDKFGKYGNTTTSYVRPHPENRKCGDDQNYARGYSVRGFNVSAPFLDPRAWNKAPRRHCCEVNGGPEQLEVRIRACNQGESVTPP